MYEAWMAMTKYKSASLSLHPAATSFHLSSSILKTPDLFRRDPLFELKV